MYVSYIYTHAFTLFLSAYLIFVIFGMPLHYLGLQKVRQEVRKFATK